MNSMTKFETVATPVLSTVPTGVPCLLPATRTAQGTGVPVAGPSYRKLDRTRLPFAGIGTRLLAGDVDGVMGADQVEATVRIPAAAGTGIPPRRTPSRC